MTLSLFSLGPLWTKHPPDGILPPALETYPGWDKTGDNPIASNSLISRAQKLLFLCSLSVVATSTIYVSADDGRTWEALLMPITAKWLYVAWTGTMYVAVTSGTTSGADKFAYSYNGYSWVAVGSFSNIVRRGGVQTNGQGGYIIPGYNTNTYDLTLDGGFTWQTLTATLNPGLSGFFQFASDGQGTVIGVSSLGGSVYMRSIDSGQTFNNTTFPLSMTVDGTPVGVFWDQGVYWVCVTPTKFWVSNDGSDWVSVTIATPVTVGGVYPYAQGILDYGGGFLYNAKRSSLHDVNLRTALGIYSTPAALSPIQRDLSSETIFGADAISHVTYKSSKLPAYNYTHNTLSGSDPGQIAVMASNGAGLIVAFKDFLSPNGQRCFTSTDDGITWTEQANVIPNSTPADVWWRGLTWDGTYFIALAERYVSAPQFCKHYYSTNGVSWTEGTSMVSSFLSSAGRLIPRVGGGAIFMATPNTGGGLPWVLPSATGTWHIATDPTASYVNSFSAWSDIAGDGAGSYMMVRRGDNTPANPAISVSNDNGETWRFYEMTGGIYAGATFEAVVWDGNKWIIVASLVSLGLGVLTAYKSYPTAQADWRLEYNDPTNLIISSGFSNISGTARTWTDGRGKSLIFGATTVETIEGVVWNLRELLEPNTRQNHFNYANLGAKPNVRHRLGVRSEEVIAYHNNWYDAAMYPHITFGETTSSLGSVTGRAVTRKAEFVSELATIGLSTAEHNLESLSTGAIAVGSPVTLSFAATPTVVAKLHASKGPINITATNATAFATSGSKYITSTGNDVVIDFSIPVDAVGFYITNAPRGGSKETDRLEVVLTTSIGLMQRYLVPVYNLPSLAGSLAFWGITDPTRKFVSVRLSPGSLTQQFGVDDIIIGINTAEAPTYDPTLVANFISTPTTASAPLIAQFEDKSGALIPVAWWWDYNDDGYWEKLDREATPRRTFFEGTYNVRLMVKWLTGQFGTVVKPAYITSNAVLPVASFYATTLTGVAPLAVQFIDTSSNFPTSWAWDFENNGSTDSTVQNPVYTFASAGTYTVKLTATNGAGSHTTTVAAYIVATQPAPVANFTATPLSGTAPLSVTFTDTSTNLPTSWAWDFENNGSTDATTQNTSHTYSANGSYTVKLTASNIGGSTSVTKTISVTSGSTVTMSFEGMIDRDVPRNYYNGGLSDAGAGPGPNYGIQWKLISSDSNLVTTSAGATFGTKVLRSDYGNPIIMTVPAGFTGPCTFMCMCDSPITVTCRASTVGGTVLSTVNGTYGNVAGNVMTLVTITTPSLCKSVTIEVDDEVSTVYIDDVTVTF